MNKNYLLLKNASAVPFGSIPLLPESEFDAVCLKSVREEKCRIAAFFAVPRAEENFLIAIFIDPAAKALRVLRCAVREKFTSLTAHYAGFNRFERDIWESSGLEPVGHPNLKPLRFPAGNIGEMDFFTMNGGAVHEVAVGPVHAGVIEPGHFRFECMGETVYSLEISLGYQHRGVEKMLTGGPDKKMAHLIESAAGDSSIAAALNRCRMIEGAAGTEIPEKVVILRRIALELERCANHIGDLGALAGDVAFLPTASFCGRIRGEYLNMTAELCGNRFGRNFIVPGSLRYPVSAEKVAKLQTWLEKVSAELWNALELMFNSPTVLDRLENTGTVTPETAGKLGLVGVAARASGLNVDSRTDLGETYIAPACGKYTGDVLSRAKVRYEELKHSHDYLRMALLQIRDGVEIPAEVPEILPPEVLTVSVTEAWRGELCHAAVTGSDGKIALYKIIDPSMHNWEGLAMALRNEEIAHFPICNKSFNLSYCGHDL
ncbi:MAG: hydrogenase [Lentisphaerae bacterium]|nr:hydrogenase [Lentisphaerota bacterium]